MVFLSIRESNTHEKSYIKKFSKRLLALNKLFSSYFINLTYSKLESNDTVCTQFIWYMLQIV